MPSRNFCLLGSPFPLLLSQPVSRSPPPSWVLPPTPKLLWPGSPKTRDTLTSSDFCVFGTLMVTLTSGSSLLPGLLGPPIFQPFLPSPPDSATPLPRPRLGLLRSIPASIPEMLVTAQCLALLHELCTSLSSPSAPWGEAHTSFVSSRLADRLSWKQL